MTEVRVIIDQAALDDLLNSTRGPVAKHLLRITQKVESRAKAYCPVDTGRLRSSINHTLEEDSRGLVGTVGTNVDYALHVEFGTRFMAAQSFLRRSLNEVVK